MLQIHYIWKTKLNSEMMKKLLLLSTVVFSLGASLKAQNTNTATVVDTLHYYFNKYYFKTGITTYSNYPFFKDPSPKCANATVTHVGSRFENAVSDLTVTGLEAYAAMPLITANLKFPVHLYLCNLNSNGMPVLPPIDSVVTEINGSYKSKPAILGGNFVNPVVVSGDFAVLIRNMSNFCGDTVYLLRTAGLTPTNVSTPAAWTSASKYSDDNFGYIRYKATSAGATFFNTKNFTLTPGYGMGTDYEFMVAPRVTYTIQASQQIPQNIIEFNADPLGNDTICTRTNFTFTNLSSWQFSNRFYNLNEFYRKWNLYYPFVAQPACCGGFSADSAITWNFEYTENALPPRDPRVFLPYRYPGTNPTTIQSFSDLAGCWDNQFRAKLRPMSAFGRQPEYSFNEPFRICLKFCNDDGTGVAENAAFGKLKMFPNPSANGSTKITGLSGENDITVYNVIGQVVIGRHVSTNEVNLDLSQLKAGTYQVKVSNSANQSKTMHLLIGQ